MRYAYWQTVTTEFLDACEPSVVSAVVFGGITEELKSRGCVMATAKWESTPMWRVSDGDGASWLSGWPESALAYGADLDHPDAYVVYASALIPEPLEAT